MSVENICKKIIAQPAPVIFVDTCIYLDLIRIPVRENIDPQAIGAAKKLIELQQSNPNKAWLVTCTTVHEEWKNNIENVVNELENGLKKSESQRKKILLSAKEALGKTYNYGCSESSLGLPLHLKSLSSLLLNSSQVVSPQARHSHRAFGRIMKGVAPAKKGKQEAKDCQIFELFLDITTQLRTAGLAHPLCFASSNSNDFGAVGESSIEEEFKPLSATYINNLRWALSIVEGQ